MKKLNRYYTLLRQTLSEHTRLNDQAITDVLHRTADKTEEVMKRAESDLKQLGKTNYGYLEMSAPLLLLLGELEQHKLTEQEIDKLAYGYWELSFAPMNGFSRRVLSVLFNFKPLMRIFFKNMAKSSAKYKAHKYSWVCDYVAAESSDEFIYAANFTQCGISTLAKEQNLYRYLPYMCAGDFADMRRQGISFLRTQTRAHGCSHCDFRWYKSGSFETQKGSPVSELKENSSINSCKCPQKPTAE